MSFLEPACKHTHISRELVLEIFDKMHQGHSAVVLGHQYSGKDILIRGLRSELAAAGFTVEILCCAQLAAGGGSAEDVFHEFCARHAAKRNWVLIVSEIDSLHASSARRLLEQIRSKADKGGLVTLVTGQVDLHDLIQRPKSAASTVRKWASLASRESFTHR